MSLMYEIFQHLSNEHQTLSVAESCTGGGLADEITKLAGISQIFVGGITAYANTVKEKLLLVPDDILKEKGAVSKEVSLIMAKNCREIFATDWALSTTGIAGPSGGSDKKPVGLVWIGLAGREIALAKQFTFSNCSRMEHRQKTIDHALQMLKYNLIAKSSV
jgi:PncC family amidohydrolase